MNRLRTLVSMRRHVPGILALTALLALFAALGRTYLGESSSPYGVCEGSNGRQIACATLAAARR